MGTSVDLNPEMRAAVDRELRDGYLRDVEATFNAGRITNCPLFSGKRLMGGIAHVDATKPIGRRAAMDLWHEIESVAGVEVIKNRS